MDTRRTNPYYLPEGEAIKEKSRLEDTVRGFKRFEQSVKIGETEGFVVEYNRQTNRNDLWKRSSEIMGL